MESARTQTDSLTPSQRQAVGARGNAMRGSMAGTPDVLILPVTSRSDAIEALKAIKALDPAARIVMCTAVGQEQMVKLAIKSGAKGYIVKPFQAPKVLEEVKNVLAL